MQSQNKDQPKKDNNNENNIVGSTITDPEEKELRKFDDWKAHSHEKHRDLKDPYRETELHGVVGKEIHDELTREEQLAKQKLLDEQKERKKSKSRSPRKNLGSSQQEGKEQNKNMQPPQQFQEKEPNKNNKNQ